jgi:hypothetical protein
MPKLQTISPDVAACAERLAATLTDGPVLADEVCRRFNAEFSRSALVHARRHLDVQVVRVDGVPHYSLPDEHTAA